MYTFISKVGFTGGFRVSYFNNYMLLIQEVCQALTCSLRELGGPCTKSMEV